MRGLLDAVVVDVGGTLVYEAAPGTAVADLVVRPRPGVAADLAALAARVPIIAATNTAVMSEPDVRALLDGAGIGPYLRGIVTSADAGAAKPDPAVLIEALRRLGTDPGRTLYVGDLPTDAEAAAAAGMPYADVAGGGVGAAVASWLATEARRRVRAAVARIGRPDPASASTAAARHDRLTKPRGALGRLEPLGVRLAAMAGACPPPLPEPVTVAVFAGDHGVLAEGVSPWPQEVTAQMVANFAAGGAAVNVLARQVGAKVVVVDVGVATPIVAADGVVDRNVRPGTANLATGPAMTVDDAHQALGVGIEVASRAVAGGARCLVTGDMGIGNTTPAAALVAAFTGRPAAEVTGRGTGVDDATLAAKAAVISRAVGRLAADAGPVEVLAEVGGLEHAALAGFVLGAAAARVPVVVDGVIAVAAALAAAALEPATIEWCIAGHRSVEPGATVGLAHLGLDPLLELDLRLGEGTGALLAVPLVQSAARILREMATFDDAGVTAKE